MPESYPEFFRRITGNQILPYQERYGRNPFSHTLLVVPTGLGKTDSVLLPWLYAHDSISESVPTRLIIVLPRQNLTAQTAAKARDHVTSAKLTDRIKVLELMGGSNDNKENLGPYDPAIIVCTQDMYFSRALNRGYARRPPRWPIDFALYNQNCLVVLDEIQLMDDALATSRQLAAFRTNFGTYGAAPCVWMSATVNDTWLLTVDSPELPPRIQLEDDDRENPTVSQRARASKRLAAAPVECSDPRACAVFAMERHTTGTRTLIIANTVPRAREIFAVVREKYPEAVLLHSRFRPKERKLATFPLQSLPESGQIVVSTQVLEAGIDITSRLLVTDVAPWGSLVQRFGRVNRTGDDADAEIWWVNQPTHAKQKQASTAPYSKEEVERAVARLQTLTSASPADLPEEDGPEPWQNVLRQADLLDLFDTTPDLSGNELDVSRFIRDTDDRDVYLGWRVWEGEQEPPPSLEELDDDELCPVSLGDLREFITKKHRVYSWNFATERWALADRDRLFAGMIAVTRASEGGYTAREGWLPESKIAVEVVPHGSEATAGDSTDRKTYQQYRQSLAAHTGRVMEEMDKLLASAKLDPAHAEALRTAATRHDWGKAHDVFQRTLNKGEDAKELLAKQCKSNSKKGHERKHFRHELASALAMLQVGDSDLSAYLVAAHHGRIRLGIRSMPGETESDGIRAARGIREGDVLRACEIARGVHLPEVELNLAIMQFGWKGGSWTDRMLQLRDELGPFRLAWLEMLLRMADETASDKHGPEVVRCPS